MDDVEEARRAAAFTEAVEALMVFDENGVVLDVNQAAAELLDLPRERLVGFPPVEDLMDVVHLDGTPFSLEEFPVVRALRTGETVAPTLMGLGPAERRVWARCSAAPLPQGGAVAMMVDVSDLVRTEEALRESEALYRLVVDNSVDVVSVWRPDQGEVFVSPAAQRITGWTPEQRRDDDEWARVHPDDLPRMRSLREDVVAGRVEATTVVFRARHADGEWYWHEMGVRAVTARDGGLEVHSSVRDVTDRVAAERARRGADARWRAAFDHGPLGQALVDVDGVPLTANEALRDLLGRDSRHGRDDRDRSVLDSVHPDDRQTAADLLAGAWDSGSGVVSALVRVGGAGPGGSPVDDATGRWTRWSAAPVEGPDGGAAYLVLQVLDVDEGVRLRDRLQHAADHDALTGLANRTHLAALLRAALDQARTESTRVAVCYLDLDGFKAANDSLGHSGGDLILCAAADRLRAVARDGDVVARVGGDEFVVVARGVADDAAAESLARRLHDAFRAPLDVAGHRFALSASLGVALSDADAGAVQAERLLGDADAAMYAAKRRGRARWARFDEAMASARVDRFALERELREALSSGELEAYLQPVVALATGRVVGAEALVRWHHPTRGLLLPADFLAVAEDSDLVVPLGWQVIEQVLDVLAAQGVDGPWISGTLSPRQLIDAGMAEQVIGLLARRGVAADRLVLEVTESALLEGGPVVEELAALDAAGVRIALDDFGTGYSSLTHLRTLPVSLLKLDRAFLATLGADPASAALVASVVSLAHALDMPAVAEGVETPEQAALLLELGCDLGQGWWFGHAEPPTLPVAAARRPDRA